MLFKLDIAYCEEAYVGEDNLLVCIKRTHAFNTSILRIIKSRNNFNQMARTNFQSEIIYRYTAWIFTSNVQCVLFEKA